MIECRQLTKSFGQGRARQTALDSVTVSFTRGEACVLMGPSGSGKTTLLSLLGCLISPTAGELWLEGRQIKHAYKGRLLEIRRRSIGFVFHAARFERQTPDLIERPSARPAKEAVSER